MGVRSLKSEVVRIAELLGGKVIFIGAVAVLAYLGWRYRATHDIDIALVSLEPKYLLRVGFREYKEYLYTPSGFKVDVYTEDVNGVPISVLEEGSRWIPVGKARIRVPRVEDLIATKLTGRARDEEDIMELMKVHRLDWDYIEARYPHAVARLRELERHVSHVR